MSKKRSCEWCVCVCVYVCVYTSPTYLPTCSAKKPTYEKVVRRIRPEDVNSTLIFGETMHHQKTLHKDDADSTRVPSCLRLHPPPRLSLPPFIELFVSFFIFLFVSSFFFFIFVEEDETMHFIFTSPEKLNLFSDISDLMRFFLYVYIYIF